MSESRRVRVAAWADCHYTKASAGLLKDVFARASENAAQVPVLPVILRQGSDRLPLLRGRPNFLRACIEVFRLWLDDQCVPLLSVERRQRYGHVLSASLCQNRWYSWNQLAV
jgi:hypothetical protein